MKSRVALVADIARQGGLLARKMQGKLSRTIKKDGSIVTDADLAVQELLFKGLCRHFPHIGLIGEEGDEKKTFAPGQALFLVDPIDGTNSYQRGLPHYGVSIGLVEEGVCVLGVFYNPALDMMFTVDAGEAFCVNGAPVQRERCNRLNGFRVMLVPSHFHRRYPVNFAGKIRNYGSTAEHLCFLATGQADAVIFHNAHLWDVAAGLAMLEAVGLRCRSLSGKRLLVENFVNGKPIRQTFLCAQKDDWEDIRSAMGKRTRPDNS